MDVLGAPLNRLIHLTISANVGIFRTSVIQTCKQQDKDFVEVGLEIIRRYHEGLDAGILTVETTAPT